eukprot:9475432-Pyramimonas_sp.AAC.1
MPKPPPSIYSLPPHGISASPQWCTKSGHKGGLSEAGGCNGIAYANCTDSCGSSWADSQARRSRRSRVLRIASDGA